MLLTIDLGTSVTKVALWEEDGLMGVGRAPLERSHLPGNRVEQDPSEWWASVVAACASARATVPGGFSSVRGIGLSAARQTFVPVTTDGHPIGPALVWSDRRATTEAADLAESLGGPDEAWRRTGAVLDAGSVAAKLSWIRTHEPQRLESARWILAPRDLVVWRLTGELFTDTTLASATGLYEWPHTEPSLVPELAGALAEKLPEVRPPTTVAGQLPDRVGRELGLPTGIPVVIGAGDRPCEVLGTGASGERPMVSWGTTANVSVPVEVRPDPPPHGLSVTAGALGGWLLEGGLSAAGSALEWLAGLTGVDTATLMTSARSSPPGARGAVALPWLGGARAPWWRAEAGGAVTGLAFHHTAADLARALVEGVAFDVARCIEIAGSEPNGERRRELMLGGGGATNTVWTDVLTAVTGLPASRRRSGEAASAGAVMVAARALGIEVDLDRMDPVESRHCPDASAVAAYEQLRRRADAAASALIGLG